MQQRYEDRPNPLFRLLVGLAAAAWLYAFFPPMGKLGLLTGASSLLPVLAALTLGQLFRWRWVRFLLALLATFAYTLRWWVPQAGLLHSIRLLLQENGREIALWFHTFKLQDPLQTELFLAVLCIVYWLVVYAALRPKLWTFYNFLAVLVLGIVDGNTPVHPNQSIVVQLLLFVGLLGVVQFRRLSGQLIYNGRPLVRFFAPLALLLVIAAGLGFVVPKPGAVWADPLAAFDNSTGSGVGPAIHQIGYQMNNTRLGGSFVANHDPVLSVITSDPTYLRGAVYSDYTGHGWLPGDTNMQPITVGQSVSTSTVQFHLNSGVKYKPLTEQVTVLSDKIHVPLFFAAYSPQKLVANKLPSSGSRTNGKTGVDVNTKTDVLYGAPLSAGQKYTVTSLEMQAPDAQLVSLPPLPKNHQSAFPAAIAQPDLELPANLPANVTQLTQALTKGMTSEYDIVMAVQNYLKLNYIYSTEGIPVPGPGQDYVSQFLFDSKKGYCNNFSSSMAVMLRTIGIPTRWVTGFTEGTMDPQYTGKSDRFVITNADAHSWVEVYFPRVGWVPFDPTPNFNMTFASPDSTGVSTPLTAPKQPVVPPVSHVVPQNPIRDNGGSGFSIPWQTILRIGGWVILIVVVVGGVIGWLFRHPIQDWNHRRRWRSDTPDGLRRGIVHLVRLLVRFGDVRKSTPTVRDLYPAAKSYGVDDNAFSELVETFEGYAYGGIKPDTTELHRVHRTWTQWVLQILRRGR